MNEPDMERRAVLDVYVAAIPEQPETGTVFPPERQREIDGVRNETLRRERYCVWKLLEQALDHSFGLNMRDLKFEKKSDGKWVCDRVFFSQSHSTDAVAVAVSDGPVGVDLEGAEEFFERFSDPARLARMEKRVCNDAELSAINGAEGFLTLWTKKEALFKCYGKGGFDPREIDTYARPSLTRMAALPARYSLSVCGEQRFFLADAKGIRPMDDQTVSRFFR